MRVCTLSLQASFLSLCILGPAVGATIRVPSEAPTIQIAIEKAQPFDTIIVAPGTYFEAINFGGKVIVVQSENPNDPPVVTSTIINAGGLGNVVTFTGGEDQVNTVLDGFTVTGGTRGIDGNNTLAVIRRCIIRNNSSHGLFRADGVIEDSQILSNGDDGLNDCDGSIRRCSIRNNASHGLENCDGSISDSEIESCSRGVQSGSVDVTRCFIRWNRSDGINAHTGDITECYIVGNQGGGVSGASFSDSGLIRNSVIAGNRSGGLIASRKNVLSSTVTGNRSYGFQNHTGTIRHVILWDNLLGALSNSTTPLFSGTANPFFVQPGFWNQLKDVWVNGDYHLSVNSPYIDAGDPGYDDNVNNPTIDIDGNPRIVGARVDIGAYEFQAECDGADFDGDGVPDVCDPDIDGDNIPNVADRCPSTPVGLQVDSEGRPLGDLDLDCRVTLRDFAIAQRQFTGP